MNGGVQLADVNGDSLVDVVFGYNDMATGSPSFNCIYINTQCGWVLQANYTGLNNSCLPASKISVRNIAISFAGLTVKQFVLDVMEQFDLISRSAVVVRLAQSGQEQGLNCAMDDLAATPGGFTVHLGSETFGFSRS